MRRHARYSGSTGNDGRLRNLAHSAAVRTAQRPIPIHDCGGAATAQLLLAPFLTNLRASANLGLGRRSLLLITHYRSPTRIEAAGNKPKLIDEFVGRVNTGSGQLSIAVMQSPSGWIEPGQRPEFDEYTIVLEGAVHVEHAGGELVAAAGQAVHARAGEWIRYSTPGGARYVAVCCPAFSPQTVHRDE